MSEFRKVLLKQVEGVVAETLEDVLKKEVDEDEAADETMETSKEIKPKAWFELSLILKEQLQVVNSFEAKNPKKKKRSAIKLLAL